MTEQLKEIAMRLKTLRQIMDVTEEEMAEVCGVTLDEYRSLRARRKGFLLLVYLQCGQPPGRGRGRSDERRLPKLSNMCVVRKGKGFKINRRQAYDYQHIAYTFRNKKVEALRRHRRAQARRGSARAA